MADCTGVLEGDRWKEGVCGNCACDTFVLSTLQGGGLALFLVLDKTENTKQNFPHNTRSGPQLVAEARGSCTLFQGLKSVNCAGN